MEPKNSSMKNRPRGRPVSLPLTIFGTLVRLRGEGLGFRGAISDRLASQGVITSKSSVERLFKLLGAYSEDAKILRILSLSQNLGANERVAYLIDRWELNG